jgi:hypothetical protein
VGADLLERVELAVIVLDRMGVVLRTPQEYRDGSNENHDDDSDDPTDQHRLLFNRIRQGKRTAASGPANVRIPADGLRIAPPDVAPAAGGATTGR